MSGFSGKPVTKETVKGSQKSDSIASDTKNVHAKEAAKGDGPKAMNK